MWSSLTPTLARQPKTINRFHFPIYVTSNLWREKFEIRTLVVESCQSNRTKASSGRATTGSQPKLRVPGRGVQREASGQIGPATARCDPRAQAQLCGLRTDRKKLCWRTRQRNCSDRSGRRICSPGTTKKVKNRLDQVWSIHHGRNHKTNWRKNRPTVYNSDEITNRGSSSFEKMALSNHSFFGFAEVQARRLQFGRVSCQEIDSSAFNSLILAGDYNFERKKWRSFSWIADCVTTRFVVCSISCLKLQQVMSLVVPASAKSNWVHPTRCRVVQFGKVQ